MNYYVLGVLHFKTCNMNKMIMIKKTFFTGFAFYYRWQGFSCVGYIISNMLHFM